jgi:Fe-S cluster biosynthesis and repair protein YggX
MPITCTRCGRESEPPPSGRVPFGAELKGRILAGICGACWKEWEGVEVKVINEYRLSFFDPQHREMLQQACSDFLKLGS